jgi:hypothetical protein
MREGPARALILQHTPNVPDPRVLCRKYRMGITLCERGDNRQAFQACVQVNPAAARDGAVNGVTRKRAWSVAQRGQTSGTIT